MLDNRSECFEFVCLVFGVFTLSLLKVGSYACVFVTDLKVFLNRFRVTFTIRTPAFSFY